MAQLAAELAAVRVGHPLRVAVDGVTAAGKSTLAAELAAAVVATGRPALQLSTDAFHHPSARRHRRGRLAAAGYYEDAYDLDAFAALVLRPLGPGGSGSCRTRIHDLATDRTVDEPPVAVAPDAVVVVDGSFLQRAELAGLWDRVVFVETSLAVARARGVARDAAALGGEEAAGRSYDLRYHAAARRYLAEVDPAGRADHVLLNDEPEAPSVR